MSSDQVETSVLGSPVQLPCGYLHKDGQIYTDAEIIPMTGITRKTIARDEIKSNAARTTDTVLCQCLKRVGPASTITREFVNNLLIGDREFLVVEIRRLSMGNKATTYVGCSNPKCQKDFHDDIDLGKLKITTLTADNYVIDKGSRVFKVVSPQLQLNATFRFPKGEDQHYLVSAKNLVEANYKLFTLCLLEWNGNNGPFDDTFFDDTPVAALDLIEDSFLTRQLGPELKQSVTCPYCNSSMMLTFKSSDFLFHRPKRGTDI